MKDELKEILDLYNSERGRRPMFQTEAMELCRQAYESNDAERIEWIRNIGKDASHRLSNIANHIAGNRFGFNITEVNESGWLMNPEFLDVEEIAFRVNDDHYSYNYITIGRGPNHKWCYAIHMSYSRGGSSYGLTVFNSVCKDRENAIVRATAELKYVIQRTIDSVHPTESEHKYLERVNRRIAQYELSRRQLSLF